MSEQKKQKMVTLNTIQNLHVPALLTCNFANDATYFLSKFFCYFN